MRDWWKKLAGTMAVMVVAMLPGCSCGDKVYKVTFDYGTDASDMTIEITDKGTITQPDNPTRDGYVFAGWYKDSEYTIPYDFATAVGEDFTLYAKWLKRLTITLAEVEDSYRMYMPEGQSGDVVEGDSVTIYLALAADYADDSNPTIAIGSKTYTAISNEIIGEEKVYRYDFVVEEGGSVSVSGVVLNSYTITLPTFTGGRLQSVVGYDNSNVAKYSDYKFEIVLDEGYEKSSAVVTIGGQTVTPYNGVYMISNVRSDISDIAVSGIQQIRYDVTYYNNDTQMTSDATDIVRLSNTDSSVAYKGEMSFDIQIVSEAYSQITDIARYVQIYVGEGEVEYSHTYTGDKCSIVIPSGVIVGDVKVVVDTDSMPINTYTLTLPESSVEDDGYDIYFSKYEIGVETTNVPNNTDSIVVPHGARVYLGADIDTVNYDVASVQLAQVYSNVIGKSYNGEGIVSFIIKQDCSFDIYGLKVKYSNVSLPNVDGVEIDSADGYTNRAYYLPYNGQEARTYKFTLDIDEALYEKTAEFVVKYSGDTIPETAITAVDGVYTITNITEDISISVVGVQEREFDITLPSSIAGVDSIAFLGSSDTTISVTNEAKTTIVVTISEGYTQSIEDITLDMTGADVARISAEGNVITYQISNVTSDIAATDIEIGGININTYTLTLPSQRDNYSLIDGSGVSIGDMVVLEHGEDYAIHIVAAAGYDEDKSYVVTINGEPTSVVDDAIIIENISSDMVIAISGIDTLNTYSITYYDYDGSVIADLAETIQYNEELNLAADLQPSLEHYTFSGWFVADMTSGTPTATNERVEERVRVTSDVALIAVQSPTQYAITYIFDEDEDISDTIATGNPNISSYDILDLASGNILLQTDAIMNGIYTVDYFTLVSNGEDTGAVVTEIAVDNIGDMTLLAHWKIVVEDGNELSRAVAGAKEYDVIELTESVYAISSRLNITKSLTIKSSMDARIEYSGIGAVVTDSIGAEYHTMIMIDGGSKTIDVVLQGIKLGYGYTTTSNVANIYATSVNLTLIDCEIIAKASAVVFDGKDNNAFNISDTTIRVTNDTTVVGENVVINRDFAIKLVAAGSNVSANIGGTIYNNADCKDFKGIYVPSTGNLANISLQGLNLRGSGASGRVILISDDHELNITDCTVYSGSWQTFVMRDKAIDISSSSDKASELNDVIEYAESVIAANTLYGTYAVAQRFADNGDIVYYVATDTDGEFASVNMSFSKLAHITEYLTLGYNMYYVGKSDVTYLTDITINQTLNMGGYNLSVNGTLINNGNLENAATLDVTDMTNSGNITASSISIGGEAANSGIISVDTMSIADIATITNDGVVNADNVINNGTMTSVNSLAIADTLTNNGTVSIDQSYADVANIINGGILHISTDMEVNGNITNNAGGVINVAADCTLTISSENLTNGGVINNYGSIVDNSEGKVVTGTINDYGISQSLSVTSSTSGNISYIEGSVELVAEDASVRDLYPTGSGYYMGLTICLGYANYNKDVTITFQRADGYEYTTKTTTDRTDSSGRLEIIIDTNYNNLTSMTITIDDIDYVLSIDV